MRARVLVISIGAHALVAGALWVAHPGARAPSARPAAAAAAIEVLDVVRREAPAPSMAPAAGGAEPAARPAPRVARVTHRRARGAWTDPRGAITVEPANGAGADGIGDGDGDGHGDGRGDGHGLGAAAPVALMRLSTAAVPAAPARSRARPARLVYPSRRRDVSDAELYVARVTIDDEGYVVGARLVRGFHGPRDTMAASLIWRFRYAPALDDDGRPIRSTLDQRFHLGD